MFPSHHWYAYQGTELPQLSRSGKRRDDGAKVKRRNSRRLSRGEQRPIGNPLSVNRLESMISQICGGLVARCWGHRARQMGMYWPADLLCRSVLK